MTTTRKRLTPEEENAVILQIRDELGADPDLQGARGGSAFRYNTCPRCGGTKQERSKTCYPCSRRPVSTRPRSPGTPIDGGPDPFLDLQAAQTELLHVPMLADHECQHGRLPAESCEGCAR